MSYLNHQISERELPSFAKNHTTLRHGLPEGLAHHRHTQLVLQCEDGLEEFLVDFAKAAEVSNGYHAVASRQQRLQQSAPA